MSKNRRKTAAALLLAAVMILGSIPVFGAGTFSDMDGSPYEDAVENLVSQGIIFISSNLLSISSSLSNISFPHQTKLFYSY